MTPIHVSDYMCKTEFVRWRKNHRKSRINKKWHKRYGAIARCKGVAYNVAGMGIVMCPCVKAALDCEMERKRA